MALLKVGSSGGEVKDLQSKLNKQLSPSPKLSVDGKFGPKTEEAVKKFQKANRLKVDGIAGPKTLAELGKGGGKPGNEKLPSTIRKSVGRKGQNDPTDVKVIQTLLNKRIKLITPMRPVAVSGEPDKQTIALIEEFQLRVVGMDRPDGRVDPGRDTFKALKSGKSPAADKDKGKDQDKEPKVSGGFSKRLDAFLKDAKNTYGVSVAVSSNTRSAAWQQKCHVAHMFVYNMYKSLKPAKTESGSNTIQWAHFSSPTLKWGIAKRDDFLRTKGGAVPKAANGAWVEGSEPDKDATTKNVRSILRSENIGNSGKAQVAPGAQGCAEPCKCGGGISRHISGNAADLNSSALKSLESKVRSKAGISLDDYLGKYGLHRPLLNNARSPEPWHVEAKK